jgi:hypothetical protein
LTRIWRVGSLRILGLLLFLLPLRLLLLPPLTLCRLLLGASVTQSRLRLFLTGMLRMLVLIPRHRRVVLRWG